MVIKQSLKIAKHYPVIQEMVYAIAAFHDLGLEVDRKTHHLESGRIVRETEQLKEWFSPEEIETMAQAVEDHRASSDHEPRSIYGKIVAEADRYVVPEKIIERTIQYGLDRYPELDKSLSLWAWHRVRNSSRFSCGMSLCSSSVSRHMRMAARGVFIKEKAPLKYQQIFHHLLHRLKHLVLSDM